MAEDEVGGYMMKASPLSNDDILMKSLIASAQIKFKKRKYYLVLILR